jgi:hypothetical protein
MTDDAIDTEIHSYHGWPVRVVCQFQITEGTFAARSFVAPAGQAERATPGGACVDALQSDAKAQALRAARKYIDRMLVD